MVSKMSKTKVLHISKYYPPYIGGIESFCHDIVSTLKNAGEYEQVVFCFNDKEETVEDIYDGVKVIRVGIQKIVASQPLAKGYGKKLKNTIEEFNPDIIHFIYPNPYAAHYFLKCDFKGKLHLDWICDIVKQKALKKLFVLQSKELLKRADFVTSITPTYFENTDYLPKYKGKKDYIACRIGDNRMNITDKQRQYAQEIKNKYGDKKIVFFFGRHTKYKGLQYLIESDEYLDQDKIQIIIAGSGDLTESLKEQAKKNKNIEFIGRLSDDDINSWLMACDIFAFPSITRNEAFGISLAEAMYFGKPACTFTIKGSGVNWVCPKNQCGLEAPNRDVKEYADNINKLVSDNSLYERLSKASIERCKELYTYDYFSKKVVMVYDELSKNVK